MNVNVVAKPGWILERFARELVRRIEGVDYNVGGYPPRRSTDHAISYYLPMKDVRHVEGGPRGKSVGLFTHGLERSKLFADRFDACVVMNARMGDFLRGRGARRVVYIRPGTPRPPRAPVFGVAGRVYGKGRKGADLVARAIADGFKFVACTERQRRAAAPCPITHSIEQRSAFYRSIDYLVVTSTDEGGPMPVLEAIAHSVPVIAPDVGFCWEFPVIRYEVGSWLSLRSVLRALTCPPSWADWAAEHRRLFASLEAEP